MSTTDLECMRDDGRCMCVASDLFELLGRKYVIDVVCVVAVHEGIRFGEIEAHLPGASTSTLSARLDDLEGAGLLRRERFDEIPPRVEYELTPRGRDLAERLRPLTEFVVEETD